jgi:hypothetical protein
MKTNKDGPSLGGLLLMRELPLPESKRSKFLPYTWGEIMDRVPQLQGLVPCEVCNKPASVNARAEVNRIIEAILNGSSPPLPPLEGRGLGLFLPLSCCRRPRLVEDAKAHEGKAAEDERSRAEYDALHNELENFFQSHIRRAIEKLKKAGHDLSSGTRPIYHADMWVTDPADNPLLVIEQLRRVR